MTITQTIYHRFQRYRTLQTDRISTLPIVILMPHSACNCRCIMCDIWKGNQHLKQLTPADVEGVLISLKKLGTKQVVLSGGEALLNPNFFRLCEMLAAQQISITLLSTGMTLARHAEQLVNSVDEIIVSLDGDEATHNYIRNIPNAFHKLKEGVSSIKKIDPRFRITSRTVIHRLNFRNWPSILDTAIELGLDQASFLPADVTSNAFNREVAWNEPRQQEILIEENELEELNRIIETIIDKYSAGLNFRFIAESPDKLRKIGQYYAAFYGLNPFPYKKCNAPWVSAVVEADGTVRPCFFHAAAGNIREQSLEEILNSKENIRFRKELDVGRNNICEKCVCSLYLSPRT